MKNPPTKYYGFFGIFGFFGFKYFLDFEIRYLLWFSFFSFFSLFLLGSLPTEVSNEKHLENKRKAKLKSSIIPMSALFLIGLSSLYPSITVAFFTLVAVLGWTLTLLAYALLLTYYEKQ